MKLSVVIPVYNEKDTLREIIKRVLSVRWDKEIILVDDFSNDGSRNILKEFEGQPKIKVLYHQYNQGKGAALSSGFQHVNGDVIVIQDADLEYDPSDYEKLLEPIEDNRADVVFGSRFLGGPHRVMFFWHYIANKALTTFSNMLTGLNLTDMETGYKVFTKDALSQMNFKCNRFGFEPEFTSKIAKLNLRVYEVPISYSGRDYSQGKKITWKDGVRAIWCIFKYNIWSK